MSIIPKITLKFWGKASRSCDDVRINIPKPAYTSAIIMLNIFKKAGVLRSFRFRLCRLLNSKLIGSVVNKQMQPQPDTGFSFTKLYISAKFTSLCLCQMVKWLAFRNKNENRKVLPAFIFRQSKVKAYKKSPERGFFYKREVVFYLMFNRNGTV